MLDQRDRAARSEAQWRRRMRRRALGALFGAVAVALALEPTCGWLYDLTPLEARHAMVAAYTRLLPEPATTADLTPMAHIGANPYGINVFLEQEVEEVKIRRSLDMIRAAGFGWIKQQLVWQEVEVPAKGQFVDRATGGSSWRKYDRIVDLAREHGLGVILRIDTSPQWARPGQAKPETPPDDFRDYGDFVARVVERYRGRVRYYQLWNEPNIPHEWGGRPPDPAAYVRLLAIGYDRVHRADPDAVVISAALAPTTEFSEHGINDLRYLQAMYDAGVRGSFDILGANAYGLRSGPDDRRLALDRDVNFSRPLLVRRVMVQNGDAGRPIWASEVGWNAVPEGSGIADLWGRVERATQAQYTARAYRRAQTEWPWMGVMSLWHFRLVAPHARQAPQYYFNAVDDDFAPLPLYESMRTLTHQRHAMQRGSRQEDDWNVAYWGDWTTERDQRAVLGSYRQSRGAAGFEVAFEGTDLALAISRWPAGGELELRVDGASVESISFAADAGEWAVSVSVASGLPDGRHVLTARTTDARPVRLDGFVVDRRRLSPGLTLDGAVLAVGALLAIATTIAGRRNARPLAA